MVSQLPKVSSVKPDFDYIKNVYEPCLERYSQNNNYRSWKNAQNTIEKGRKILESNEEVDTYIAFYGAHHYYKLVEAFDALNIKRFTDARLEIFSYGCGAATDTCSLISYCQSQQINLTIKSFTLIEPSQVALERGIEYINQALSSEELDNISIKKIYKSLEYLQENELFSEPETAKIHIFSNILDIQVIKLDCLASLIRNSQVGSNYFICVNPNNFESKTRIDDFCNELSKYFKLSNICTNDREITDKTVWVMKDNRYDNRSIHRYHKIFQADS